MIDVAAEEGLAMTCIGGIRLLQMLLQVQSHHKIMSDLICYLVLLFSNFVALFMS